MSTRSPSKQNPLWKGKAKAVQEDYDDLSPTITYRHMLSHNLGIRDPLRVIVLCDCDAFYAACEQVRLGIDTSLPLVVLQWDSLIAVNYPARKFGITRMAKLKDAKRMCPELVVVHVATYKEGEREPGYWDDVDTRTHKVSLDYYRRESMKIINMFKDALPTGEIEKASIDEAFLDLTRPVRDLLLERYPYLAQVPPDAPNGIDSPLPPPPPINWDTLGNVIPIHPDSTEVSGEEVDAVQVEDDQLTTWHDVALSIAAELMGKVRADVHQKLGYTTSAGISRNKFLAKLCASYKKPNEQSILRNIAIPNYLRPLGFQKIRFLGGKLGEELAKVYDVSTVGDLLTVTLEEMQNKFGEDAIWVYELLRGIDRSEVKEKSAMFKSMLASKNLPQPITKSADGHHWIRVLAAELALRLKDARETSPTLWPKSIVLHARKGYNTARSKQAAFPFVRNITVDVIALAGDKLWKELTGSAKTINVTSVQLAFTGLEMAEQGQQSIEGFFKTGDHPATSLKRPRDDDDLDLNQSLPDGIAADNEANSSPSKQRDNQRHSSIVSDGSISFVCTTCGERIVLPDNQSPGEDDFQEERRAEALARLKLEHEDFHFAEKLARSSNESTPSRLATGKTKRKKMRSEPQGIAKFFSRQ